MTTANRHECGLTVALQQELSTAENLNHAFSVAMSSQARLSSAALVATFFETTLGPMLAIADNQVLMLLEFFDRKALLKEIERLRRRTKKNIVPGESTPITVAKAEIEQYFNGTLKEFTTPIVQCGTQFQMLAWDALKKIPYGETRSYQQQAEIVGHPAAHRAIANANGCNQLAIIYPCHRIIKSDGGLGGYGGRISRKKWLLDFEKSNVVTL